MRDVTIKFDGGCRVHLSGFNAEEVREFCRRFMSDEEMDDSSADVTIGPTVVGSSTAPAGNGHPQNPPEVKS